MQCMLSTIYTRILFHKRKQSRFQHTQLRSPLPARKPPSPPRKTAMQKEAPPFPSWSPLQDLQPHHNPFLLPQQGQDTNMCLGGFCNVSLPIHSHQPHHSCAALKRCFTYPSHSPPCCYHGLELPMPETLFPPRVRMRCSVPNSSPANAFSPSSSMKGMMNLELAKELTPDAKRMKRLKDQVEEVTQLYNQIMFQKDREEDGAFGEDSVHPPKLQPGTPVEERVSVETLGDCLAVNFKCPCGKGYQILLSGRNCYYKLM